MFQTSVGCFFSVLSHELKTWFKLSRVKLYRHDRKGGLKLLLISRRFEFNCEFELPRVKLH